MFTSGMRPATLKYLTFGSSGVLGLKTSFRYEDVKLAYAGESTTERRRVVNEEGREERESVNDDDEGEEELDAGGGGVGGGGEAVE